MKAKTAYAHLPPCGRERTPLPVILCEAIVIDGSSLIKSLSKLFASLCGRQRVSLSPLQ